MEKIRTQSTSSKSAVASPIVVRETETIRLIFKPTLVANENQPRACIKGEFIYQRKKGEDEWEDANTESLATIKSGEQYKLSLHSAELLALMEALGPLYRAQWSAGGVIQKGLREYVAIDKGLAEFLRAEDHQLKQILDASPDDAAAFLGKMLAWISSSESLSILEKLSELEKDRLPAVTALLGLSSLKTALNEWESNKNNASERYWQEVLSKYSFVIGQLFAHPVVVIREQAYLGG